MRNAKIYRGFVTKWSESRLGRLRARVFFLYSHA